MGLELLEIFTISYLYLVHDTEDDSSIDFLGDGSSSEGRKTPTLTPRKSILKSPKVSYTNYETYSHSLDVVGLSERK